MWTLSILLKLQYELCPSCRLLQSFLPSPHFLLLSIFPPSLLLKCISQVSAYFACPCPSVFPKCILQVYFSSAFPNSLFRSPPFPGGGKQVGKQWPCTVSAGEGCSAQQQNHTGEKSNREDCSPKQGFGLIEKTSICFWGLIMCLLLTMFVLC